MKTKKTTNALCLAVLAVACIAAALFQGNHVGAAPGDDTWLCAIAGTYVNLLPPFPPQTNDAVATTTLVALDPLGSRLKMTEQWANADQTLLGMFPEADWASDMGGEAVRTGHDTYKFTILGYGGKKVPGDRGELQYIWSTVGSLRIVNCDTIETFDTYAMVYLAHQDKDKDGLPDEDEKPIFCMGPLGELRNRVRMLKPCTPEPMPQGQ